MAFINDHTWSVKVVRRLIRRPNLCLVVPKGRPVVAFFAAQMWSENCFEALLLNGFFRFLSSAAPMNLFLHQLFLSLSPFERVFANFHLHVNRMTPLRDRPRVRKWFWDKKFLKHRKLKGTVSLEKFEFGAFLSDALLVEKARLFSLVLI